MMSPRIDLGSSANASAPFAAVAVVAGSLPNLIACPGSVPITSSLPDTPTNSGRCAPQLQLVEAVRPGLQGETVDEVAGLRQVAGERGERLLEGGGVLQVHARDHVAGETDRGGRAGAKRRDQVAIEVDAERPLDRGFAERSLRNGGEEGLLGEAERLAGVAQRDGDLARAADDLRCGAARRQRKLRGG